MSTYQYIFADLLTNKVLGTLPLAGVSFSRQLNKAGNFQGSFGLKRSGYSDADIIDMTIPGRTALYIERTTEAGPNLVWGGIIWSRTYQEQSYSLQLTGQTFESFPYKADLRQDLNYAAGVDQRIILLDMWRKIQLMSNRNLGIIIPADPAPGAYIRTPVYYEYESWNYGKLIENLLDYVGSFDHTIHVRYNGSGNPERYLMVDNVLGNPIEQTGLVFDYPGTIKNYWWPENASRGATTVVGVGAGEGVLQVRSRVTNTPALTAGYPDLAQFYTNKDTTDQTTLDSQAINELSLIRAPISVPTFQLNSDESISPNFGDYQLGDYAKFSIKSPRWASYPDSTRSVDCRIIGWNVKPGSSETVEDVQLVIAETSVS